MQVEISEKSKQGFIAAAQKLSLSTELPTFSNMREDLAHWLMANYMLAVIIEAGKEGQVHDITNHSVRKYTPYHIADDGYIPGSSGGGFSCNACGYGRGYACVGARLTSNSSGECRNNAEEYPDLWEIVILNIK